MPEIPNYKYRGLEYYIKRMGTSKARWYIVKHNGARIANALSRPHAKTLARVHADGILGMAPKLLPR